MLGYSVGKWEGDTLVVDSIGFNGKTCDDPKAYTKPWTVKQDPRLVADTELLEFICNENEKDIVHMRPK